MGRRFFPAASIQLVPTFRLGRVFRRGRVIHFEVSLPPPASAGNLTCGAYAWRAYYVRVRRNQDTSDGQIADEVGERTGVPLIRSTYGDPDGIRGDGLYDGLPPSADPAWVGFAGGSTSAVIPFRAAG